MLYSNSKNKVVLCNFNGDFFKTQKFYRVPSISKCLTRKSQNLHNKAFDECGGVYTVQFIQTMDLSWFVIYRTDCPGLILGSDLPNRLPRIKGLLPILSTNQTPRIVNTKLTPAVMAASQMARLVSLMPVILMMVAL